MKSIKLNIPVFVLTLFGIAVLLVSGIHWVEIDTDITRYLPGKDRVLSDAGYLFAHNPIQGEMVVDLGTENPDPDRLVECSRKVMGEMAESGLFTSIGTESVSTLVPGIMTHAVDSLPVLFTEAELYEKVAPLLTESAVKDQVATLTTRLLDLSSIGQAGFISKDPLSLRNIVLARLSQLAPSQDMVLYKGNLLSSDRRHLLITAVPKVSATDTAYARKLDALMTRITAGVKNSFGGTNPVTLSAVGAYRNALDNERIARRDVTLAIVLSTLCIALLLLFSFPRPVLGLFAFLPAVAGTAAAFFVLALLYRKVSLMALGFGGAVISITVDHGIAYLLFLDRPRVSYGREASREIRALGLMAALTSIGAFGALGFTDFPVFEQLGRFAALGIGFSFLFVHYVFPKIFRELPAADPRPLPFRTLVEKIPVSGKRSALAALGVAVILAFFAVPKFDVRLSSMNTVSGETAAAEALVTRVWGSGLFSRVYVMAEADSPEALQVEGDRLLAAVNREMAADRITAGFMPSMIYPGEAARAVNFAAWKKFWTPERVRNLKETLLAASSGSFSKDAFIPFFQQIEGETPPPATAVPKGLYPLMEMVQTQAGWAQFASLTPGPAYDAEAFFDDMGESVRIFDANYFSRHLGRLLFFSFMKMCLIVGGCVVVLLLFFFLDIKLTAITLSPVLFSLVCTLGTLKLLGNALDIPALMLAIIVLGMGVDYAIYLVRSYQRYGDATHPEFGRIRLAVILAALSTLIGFGIMCLADHAMLRSAGLSSFLGIGFCLVGAFVLLPPLLKHHFSDRTAPGTTEDFEKSFSRRYRTLPAYPRLFARFKTRLDPMFSELPRMLAGCRDPGTLLDIGCGFGVPGCWLLTRYENARIYAIEPDPERVRVAARVFGDRGYVVLGAAPEIPVAPEKADATFLLDISHFIEDAALSLTFSRLRGAMRQGAPLVIRAVVPPPDGRVSLLWKIDALRMKLAGIHPHHRQAAVLAEMVTAAGFSVKKTEISGGNRESVWLVARTE